MGNMSTADARRRVYDMYERDCADLPAEHPGVEITEELAAGYVSELRAMGYGGNGNTRHGQRFVDQVLTWLLHPERHSPHVDEIAVERALSFDWSAFSSLSPAERAVFGDRLARMPNPLSEPEPGGGDRGWAGVRPSSRRSAYGRGTYWQQRAVRGALRRAQARMAKTADA